jgi:hypothetical protein
MNASAKEMAKLLMKMEHMLILRITLYDPIDIAK